MNPRTAVLSLLLTAALTGCSTGTGTGTVQPPPEPTASAATPGSPAPARAAARLIEARYEGGEIRTAEPRVEVARGDELVLRITSDVAEEIHVHGYDLTFALPAGETVEKSFVADLPGQWAVELHQAGRPMLVLKVA